MNVHKFVNFVHNLARTQLNENQVIFTQSCACAQVVKGRRVDLCNAMSVQSNSPVQSSVSSPAIVDGRVMCDVCVRCVCDVYDVCVM